MSTLLQFPAKAAPPAGDPKARTYRAMLKDTAELLGMMRYANAEDAVAAQAQAEAINDILKV